MLLLYGVRLVTDALQRASDRRVRYAITQIAKYPPATFGIGILATLLTQSSSAVSSLLVGLVSAQLMPLATAIIMLLGSNVGSTLVVQFLAFHITDYAPQIAGLGALIALFTRHTSWRRFGQTCFAFSLILLGLAILAAGSAPLASSPVTATVIKALVSAPLILGLLGIALAVAFTSSAASIGLVIVLASTGTLPARAALTLMLGANVGTTLIALFTALGQGSLVGRRLALVHTGTKLSGAVVVFALLDFLEPLLAHLWPNPGMQVAFAHLGFNLALALVFGPLCQPLVRVAEWLLPDAPAHESGQQRYLDLLALNTPAVALGLATREILRMADVVMEMLARSIHAFEDAGTNVPSSVGELDDQLDELEEEVKHYLTQLDEALMSEEQIRRKIALLYIITALEAIGDVIDKQMMQLAKRRRRDQVMFSEEGWQDLMAYHHEVTEALQQVIAALATQDPSLAAEFLGCKAQLHQSRRALHLRHLQRLHSGLSPSIASSSIHLDLLNAMGRVLSYASNMAHAIQGDL
ncbi:Na/Pi cotransporter family protein [Ktedonosporobacter rubrisoli]|uniref:Na/Pi cotransporter family protein n=2 Tax=Ktedonosporobacter rubrisoli TaxID=2509675 RepID=A0A4V0Z0L0_KTERU|nr:Na/Pi cotransporter family protein [Ktedonosporobacter rubrisoli]